MHPEIVSDKPGHCPECGMELMPRDAASVVSKTEDKGLGILTWRNYAPLIVVILMILTAAGILPADQFILNFMTGFFLVFGGFKLIDLGGFAKGYFTYDFLAQRWFGYGYVYPFIELSFGFLMLAGFHPVWLLWTEFSVMTFSGLGVLNKLLKKEQFNCVCLGTFFKVPLTYVTLVEDFGMAFLAILLIWLK